jgi:toxin-antitoxin system PIN domain toxin
VIAVDTNLLVMFHRLEFPRHAQAVTVIRQLAEGNSLWAIPWPCVHEFLAVVTNPRIFKEPTPAKVALTVMDALMESPSLRLLHEGPAYWPHLKHCLVRTTVVGARVHDARIAALCLAHGVKELWTADRDFSQFTALKSRNPIE